MAEKKKPSVKKVEAKSKSATGGGTKMADKIKSKASAPTKVVVKTKVRTSEASHIVNKISPPRVSDERKPSRGSRVTHQYNYMKAPGIMHDFQVGDKVEVYCDHEKGRERVRGWVSGIVVQVDNKMVAVQFRSNVYLTDGWMVPDRILWYSLSSEHIRPDLGKKSSRKEAVIKIVRDDDY
ncbi:MAG: hypothetical protein IPP66_16365 [Anaerolineales bacterium]|nr:hypothetical protein [Anaerolineales bacterium]